MVHTVSSQQEGRGLDPHPKGLAEWSLHELSMWPWTHMVGTGEDLRENGWIVLSSYLFCQEICFGPHFILVFFLELVIVSWAAFKDIFLSLLLRINTVLCNQHKSGIDNNLDEPHGTGWKVPSSSVTLPVFWPRVNLKPQSQYKRFFFFFYQNNPIIVWCFRNNHCDMCQSDNVTGHRGWEQVTLIQAVGANIARSQVVVVLSTGINRRKSDSSFLASTCGASSCAALWPWPVSFHSFVPSHLFLFICSWSVAWSCSFHYIILCTLSWEAVAFFISSETDPAEFSLIVYTWGIITKHPSGFYIENPSNLTADFLSTCLFMAQFNFFSEK